MKHGADLPATEAALRPHRGATVLTLGVLSTAAPLACLLLGLMNLPGGQLFIPSGLAALPLGIAAFVLGTRQLAGMRDHRIDLAGRTLSIAGRLLGLLGAVGWAAITACFIVLLAHAFGGESTTTVEGPPGTRHVTTNHLGVISEEWQETRRPDGSWVKDGPAVIRISDGSGRKIEEGDYRDGKRDGRWTFWAGDGSIDEARSGVYQEGVRIEPSPVGDFPVDDDVR